MSKYDQCEHRLHCGTCVKTGKLCPHLPQNEEADKCGPYDVDPLPKVDWIKDQVFNIPDCCVNCPNHPTNGGSGICNCVLPYMNTTNILQSTAYAYSVVNYGDSSSSVTMYDPKIPHTYTDTNGIHG